MDLWILSQDKHNICKATCLTVGKNCFSEWCVFNNDKELGSYEMEERAMEILNQISKLLIGDIVCFNNIKPSNTEIEELKQKVDVSAIVCSCSNELPTIDYLHRDCVVFEMPEE